MGEGHRRPPGKTTKNINPREHLSGKQLVRHSEGKAPYQENSGYYPDLELSESRAEGDGIKRMSG